MSLSTGRAKLIASWLTPQTPRTTLSRLCSLQYFNLLLPFVRYLVPCLQIFSGLPETEDYVGLKEIHVKEFLAVKILICCSVQFLLVDLRKPLILSSDAR